MRGGWRWRVKFCNAIGRLEDNYRLHEPYPCRESIDFSSQRGDSGQVAVELSVQKYHITFFSISILSCRRCVLEYHRHQSTKASWPGFRVAKTVPKASNYFILHLLLRSISAKLAPSNNVTHGCAEQINFTATFEKSQHHQFMLDQVESCIK